MHPRNELRVENIAQRLRSDFRLALMVLFGLLTLLGVTPFTIYRFVQGDLLVAIIDLVVQLGVAAIVLYAWYGSDVRRAGSVLIVFGALGCVATGYLSGTLGLLWLYPVLVASFVLAPPRVAMAASLVSIAALAGHPGLESGADMATMVVTALVVSVFAYLFAHQTRVQHRLLEELAARDPLTGALNRLTMEPALQQAIDNAVLDRRPVGLLVLDLDGFKQVNDAHGHEAGDFILCEVAERVRALIRQDDRLFRLGGDEFALLLPGADSAALERIGGAICRDIARHGGSERLAVTASVGAAVLRPGEGMRDWMHRADTAMYEAKHGGSNRVVVAPALPADDR